MGEISNMILRMRELAVQMENGIYTSKDRDNAQLEVNALLQEIDKIASNTRFNDVKLLDGAYDQTIRAGNTNAETIRVRIDALTTAGTANIEAYSLEKATQTSAAANGTATVLTSREAGSVEIDTSVFSSSFKEIFKGDALGEFKLVAEGSINDNTEFSIDAKTGKITSNARIGFNADTGDTGTGGGADTDEYKFHVQYWIRGAAAASHTEKVTLNITNSVDSSSDFDGTQLDDIQVETAAEASRAVETLDKALEEVSSAQAKLGAIQNRLQHNIDNLSKGAMLTEQSVGRVVDADFATETSNLSKQQILNQAATAMLAQANQSKQSVLSLLQ
jgi:flagellin